MQYGETYVGRRFRLVRPHYESIDPNFIETFSAGWIGVLKSVNIKAGEMLLEFETPRGPMRAKIKEANVVLDSAPAGEFKAKAPSGNPDGTRTEQSEPTSVPRFKRLQEYEPKLTEVKSSNIKAIGHEGGDLIVAFTNGTGYGYAGVPEQVYAMMLESESVGKFFNAKIKGNTAYESTKLEA